jgi:hypothetical protein
LESLEIPVSLTRDLGILKRYYLLLPQQKDAFIMQELLRNGLITGMNYILALHIGINIREQLSLTLRTLATNFRR